MRRQRPIPPIQRINAIVRPVTPAAIRTTPAVASHAPSPLVPLPRSVRQPTPVRPSNPPQLATRDVRRQITQQRSPIPQVCLNTEPIRGVVVSVGYDDLLAITLVRNMRHFTECWVVTTPTDEKTKEVCAGVPGVKVFETDAFYRYGAKFNKSLSLELAFEAMGRSGWTLIHDADIILPELLPLPVLQVGKLYGAHRLFVDNPKDWHPEYDWKKAKPTKADRCIPGFFQLFHASDQHITELPWYDVTFTHAGGGDGYFQNRWPKEHAIKLPFDVLHLGPRDTNWFGRASERLDGAQDQVVPEASDAMHQFLAYKGWGGRKRTVTEFEERVIVPGQPPRPAF